MVPSIYTLSCFHPDCLPCVISASTSPLSANFDPTYLNVFTLSMEESVRHLYYYSPNMRKTLLASCGSQFLLDRLGKCLKLFVSTVGTSCHKFASQYGLEMFLYAKLCPKTTPNIACGLEVAHRGIPGSNYISADRSLHVASIESANR